MDRIKLETTVSPAFAAEVRQNADKRFDGKISQYIKAAISFYENFGVKNGYVEKIKAAAEKEKRTPQGLVTSIVENYFDRVRYIKQFV